MTQESSQITEDKPAQVEPKNDDLSNNVIDRLFGLFENVLGRNEYWRSFDASSVQQQVNNEEKVLDNSVNELPSPEVESDPVPSAQDSSEEPSEPVVPTFPSPTPADAAEGELNLLTKFRELYTRSPRQASKFFEENSQEILKDYSFF